jgi:hypothetical protein
MQFNTAIACGLKLTIKNPENVCQERKHFKFLVKQSLKKSCSYCMCVLRNLPAVDGVLEEG